MEIVDLYNIKERMELFKILRGKYFDLVGYIFLGYCIWKIFIFIVNIVFDRVGKIDFVIRGIEIIVNYFGWKFDVFFWL